MSEHFSLDEFERSSNAARRGLDNRVPHELMPNLQRLVELLEAVRLIVGPIHITSGYRSPEVNRLAGGAANSAHLQARAADIDVEGMTPHTLAVYIDRSDIAFDKCIKEFDSWVHVQVAREGGIARKEVLTAKHTAMGTVYLPGLEA